ncbi:TolB-like translocation protein [Algoriphagus pacificus]|uniref:PD40 domain-containing protein n=1 Tax=Algoriphagus pacificus TaxID=2811234 RepID=A0ABS3CHA4_9BACT|nr:PD40 domain-containing protein [Algoriphagus pacificus]MBN7815019.1 PD40 domain-containing protein [Algoriphagus pacificus]
MKGFYLVLFLEVILFSCNQKKYPVGIFPEEAVNLSVVNSSSDDMNSDIPTINHEVNLIFSSNRIGSQPNHYNLVESSLVFYWDKSEGILSVNKGNTSFDTSIRDWVKKTESTFNEKGPYSFSDSNNDKFLLFSRDNETGIYSIHLEPESSNISEVKGNISFRVLDDFSNEMYPSFYGKDFLKGAGVESQGKVEKMLFTSDKDGTFDIYEVDIPANSNPIELLIGETEKNIKKLSINTTANEHMPFVYGDILVFSSDRPGGLGGFDLYYSLKTADGWTEPENFGPKVNSEFDEYRPVVSDHPEFSNRVMIFSSNRPGGLGGFDLYFVGIPKF